MLTKVRVNENISKYHIYHDDENKLHKVSTKHTKMDAITKIVSQVINKIKYGKQDFLFTIENKADVILSLETFHLVAWS